MKNLFLSDVMQLYAAHLHSQHPKEKAQNIKVQTETAINRYTLPGCGMEAFEGPKPTRVETDRAKDFRQNLSVEKLPTLLEAQEKTFELLQTSRDIKNVNRSRLKQLIAWGEKQSWWPGNTSPDKVMGRCPSRHQKYGPMQKTLLVKEKCSKLKPYGLKTEQISKNLKAETELFRQFRTATHWSNRPDEPVKVSVANKEIKVIFQVLGWFHNHQGVALKELSLNTLIPCAKIKYATSKKDATAAAKAGDYVDSWICKFCKFLIEERNAKSPKTHCSYIETILAVAKFQYHTEITSKDYREVPAIEKLRLRLTLTGKEIKNYISEVDMDKKWLKLPEILKQIVEPLRLECQPRAMCGNLRRKTAIASSFQRYILWGLLTYVPPRRQQELRGLKIGLECPIKRPDGVPANGLYHPLPPIKKRDRNCPYLCKTPDGRWIRDTTPECYKTGKTYGHQELEIPNVPFDDGTWFYDYLEAWLYGYYKMPDGSWRSWGGNFNPGEQDVGDLWVVRLVFNPNHDFVFVQPNGKPFTMEGMCSCLSSAAHALTGQRVSPHLMRDIFATHFLDNGASDSDVASLAYAMGHSQEMLRASYDRRTPNQKHRPIQSAMSKLVQESLSKEP